MRACYHVLDIAESMVIFIFYFYRGYVLNIAISLLICFLLNSKHYLLSGSIVVFSHGCVCKLLANLMKENSLNMSQGTEV